jgi:hypothetical protein
MNRMQKVQPHLLSNLTKGSDRMEETKCMPRNKVTCVSVLKRTTPVTEMYTNKMSYVYNII